MLDALSFTEKFIGVTTISPSNLRSDGELLRMHLKVSCKRYALLLGTSICVTPVVYALSRRLSLSQQVAVRNFLDAEDGKNTSNGVRVVYGPPSTPKDGVEKGDRSPAETIQSQGRHSSFFSHFLSYFSPFRLLSSVCGIYRDGKGVLRSCKTIVYGGAALIGGGTWEGIQRPHDLPNRVVAYTLTHLIRFSTTRWVVSCVVQVSFFCICLAIERVLATEAFSSLKPLENGWYGKGGSPSPVRYSGTCGENASPTGTHDSSSSRLAGVYQLGDFSYSAMGFITRSSGRWLRGVVMCIKIIFAPHTNFYWMEPRCADSIWCQLTPAGFVLSTFLAVLPSILYAFWSGFVRTLLLLHKRSKVKDSRTSPCFTKLGFSLPSFHLVEKDGCQGMNVEGSIITKNDVRGGSITVGKVATKRELWKSTKKYLINYHFLGAPLFAFLGASYAWKTQHIVFLQHTAGGAYESVSIALFLWSLITLFISTPDIEHPSILV